MSGDSLARQNAKVLRHAKDVMAASERVLHKCRVLDKRLDQVLLDLEIRIAPRYRKKLAKRKPSDQI